MMQETASEADVIIEARGLSKSFGGFQAVKDLDFGVRRGTIHALIGPNGAGKTTVFNLLTKFLQPTAGTIRFGEHDITRSAPSQVARLGMVRSFQISATFLKMTALENVRVAMIRSLGLQYSFWRPRRSIFRLDARAMELLEEVGLADAADVVTANLSYGRRRALEIATTLALDPELLLLDEPTSGMGREDVDRTSALIRKVAKGRTVLLVEHNLSIVANLSDSITVLARGRVLAQGAYAEVSSNPRVREVYLGDAH